MKTRIFSLILIAMIAISCSTEEQNINMDPATNLELSKQTQKNGETEFGSCPSCDLLYDFPRSEDKVGFSLIKVEFDSSLSLGEIHCLKFEYFECYYKGHLYVHKTQSEPLNQWKEDWLVRNGKPNNDVLNDICNDPMTSSPQCDD